MSCGNFAAVRPKSHNNLILSFWLPVKKIFSSSLSSCKKLYFLNTLSPVLSTPLSYVCCVCMDRLMANFAGTCTSDNKGLLLLLLHKP